MTTGRWPRPCALGTLQIVSYSVTPLVGVPAILARCINARTCHSCRGVQGSNTYPNGPLYDSDLIWNGSPDAADRLLSEADLVIVHNGNVDARHEALLETKPVVTMAHHAHVNDVFVQRGFPGLVVGQYQATLKRYRAWAKVSNPVPFWEPDYTPDQKPTAVSMCYTPAGKHERYPQGHRYYWHAKGYASTMRILDRLARRFPIQLNVIRDNQIPQQHALAMKRRSHIVIDECVTGSYHRNSLEGLATGCLVVNGVGLLAGVREAFRYCAGYPSTIPFVYANLNTIEAALSELIESGPERLQAQGLGNRRWIEQHWDFRWQWEHMWEPAIRRALRVAGVPL